MYRHKAPLGVIHFAVTAMLCQVHVLDVDRHAKVREPCVLAGQAESPVNDENGNETQDWVEAGLPEPHVRGGRPNDPAK
jgi:hypothetical protein